MAGLQAPLSTLGLAPRDALCMTSGPAWFAIPFPLETFTLYNVPISRRASVRKLPLSWGDARSFRRKSRAGGSRCFRFGTRGCIASRSALGCRSVSFLFTSVAGSGRGTGPMAEILVEVRPSAAAGDLTGPTIPESFMSRVEDLGQSLKEIAERLSQQLEDFEKKRAAGWQLERVELKFSFDLEAEAGIIIARTKTSAGFEASLAWKSSSA